MTRSHRARARRRALPVLFLLSTLLLGVAVTAARAEDPPAGDTRFTPPPGEESAEIRGLIDQAKAALGSGRTVTDLLTDGRFMPARAWPRFRALVRDGASAGAVTMVPASEPGEPLRVRGTVRDAGGQPMKGALLYVYQTDARGWYSDRAGHVSGQSGDQRHARLFAYLRTDAEGTYEFRTIRPAGYPATDLPAHIHVEIASPGGRPQSYVTEIRFEDDPRLTPAWRERSRLEGSLIFQVTRGADNVQQVIADFQVR